MLIKCDLIEIHTLLKIPGRNAGDFFISQISNNAQSRSFIMSQPRLRLIDY